MKFLDANFCDDIRQEINNKISLMGLYNDRIVLHIKNQNEISWPQPINLSALLRFSIKKYEERPDRFEFEYFLNKKNIVKIAGELHINTIDRFQLIINGTGIPLERGNLGFLINLYARKNLLLSEKKEKTMIISVTDE